MSVLTRFRGRARSTAAEVPRSTAGLTRSTVGEAVVVHDVDDTVGVTAEARALAESLPVDPDHLYVVADLPAQPTPDMWEAFVAALPEGGRPVVVLPIPLHREIDPQLGHWLAARTGGVVLTPRGPIHRDARGALFAHAGPDTGWLRFGSGPDPVWGAKRLPRPAWEFPVLAETRSVGKSVAEPLPAGMWLRPAGPDSAVAGARVRLTRTMPCRDEPVIVLGGPGLPELPVADVAAYWQALPVEVQATAWFVKFGPVGAFGTALADELDAKIRCYAGIPAGWAPDVFTVRADGSYGWNTFAKGFAHRRGQDPELLVHRPPVADLPEVSPGVYQCGPGVVVEVVESGLWVRSGRGPVPDAPLDPVRVLVHHEPAEHVRAAAENLVRRLDYPTALVSVLAPTAPEPVVPDEDDEQLPMLSRLMETIVLPRISVEAADDPLAAVRKYLSGDGPARPAAFEVLPMHEGAAVTTLTPADVQWAQCQTAQTLVEPGYLHVVTEPCIAQEGNVDVLVWSVTGRRTESAEPATGGVPDRVVFLPGTRFRVLDSVGPEDGQRGWIALREVPADEPAVAAAEQDEEILDVLSREVEGWLDSEPRQRIPESAAHWFTTLPGCPAEGLRDAG
ncbi:hypothetical protein [Amycolatopsis jejuensis]|uniref:hypothetical protein n=1 Tax=Amycolatopsis jejuensis TaxID=330084 RepID=UPI000527D824|nr:hypothetical protein [Amycolatopsis jejuensis]